MSEAATATVNTPSTLTPENHTGLPDAVDEAEAALLAASAIEDAERATAESESAKPKPKRGGKRPGAGRKPAAPKVEDPPPPFSGIVDAASAAPNAPPPMVLAAPEELADLLVVALDGAVVAIATKRYGPEMGQSLAAKEEAKQSIKLAAVRFIESSAVKMTPGQALAVAILGAYVPPVVVAEMMRKSTLAAQGVA
jgi:hypothetical protein